MRIRTRCRAEELEGPRCDLAPSVTTEELVKFIRSLLLNLKKLALPVVVISGDAEGASRRSLPSVLGSDGVFLSDSRSLAPSALFFEETPELRTTEYCELFYYVTLNMLSSASCCVLLGGFKNPGYASGTILRFSVSIAASSTVGNRSSYFSFISRITELVVRSRTNSETIDAVF